ncbi:MAG: OB-fold domain-containing protein [Actinomycetota bacterium]|nr:OB-fold domain-containing protein [Actinomycetota bacterium]
MRGVIACGGYMPYHRLRRAAIGEVVPGAGGQGTRSVASFDEDTTTMGVEAARLALRGAPDGISPDTLWFSTVVPAYLDKTNATGVHAALRLPPEVPAFDGIGSVRSASGTLRAALLGSDATLVVAADLRSGLPGSRDEADGGDGASALLVGGGDRVIAEYLGGASVTDEFVDRWRTPGDNRSKVWEERFGETKYLELGQEAWKRALAETDLAPGDVTRVAVSGTHARAVRTAGSKLGAKEIVDDLSATVGNTGAAHPGLLLSGAIEQSSPGDVLALVVLADGADVFLFRATEALASYRPARPVAGQIAGGGEIPYGKFLAWRGMLPVEPPRRPEPSRISASAAARAADWKYGFVGSKDRSTGAVHLPPSRVSREGGAVDDMEPVPMAERQGTIATFTVDRLVYSPSPPVVFAVVDFDDGGRFPVELTDVDPEAVAIGDRVEMTFRRMFTADGLHNYFWKARPVRA